MDKKPKVYFQLPITEARKWGLMDYFVFITETSYSTIFPFISGMAMVHFNNLIWGLMLILPIYFKFTIQRKDTKSRKKRIYVKE